MGSHQEGSLMVRSGKGKIVNRGTNYPKIFVYIPKDVALDTSFPFKIGQDVNVTVEGRTIVIRETNQSS